MKSLGYLTDAPVTRFCEDLEQTDVVYVEVGVGASGQDAGFELEMAKQSGNALVEGYGLMVVDFASVGGASFHCGHHSTTGRTLTVYFIIRILRLS